MPWSGMSFQKHNHGLSPAQSAHAAAIANHVLRSTGNEGEAIATANKLARRDTGGMVDPAGAPLGGLTPSAESMSPQVQGLVRQYSALSVEKLQEMRARLAATGSSPYARIIDAVLQQKMAMPSVGMQPAQAAAHGGMIRLASGGNPMGMSLSMASPWWERSESYNEARSGLLTGATPGRADQIKTTAPGGAYIIPADVIAGLGEGNTLAGARVMDEMMRSGPLGTPMPRGSAGRGPPRPPAPLHEAKGGGIGGSRRTPVALSHGEYVVQPEDVARVFGDGDMKRGHRVLDRWVVHMRAKHIKKLKSLPGPVGAKK
jgi:hypothetical protein